MGRECCCGFQHEEERCGFGKRFLTKAERIKKLKSYEEELKKELTAVQEHITELGN